jgi:RNA polymerase sigma-70 factor (ECF subfamily)
LYRDHVDAVHRYTLAALGDVRDAEDATQTTFLNAYRAFRRGERAREPGSWLIAIARNVCRQRYRQRSRRPTETELSLELTPAPKDPVGEFGDVLVALRQLPFRQRAAFVMHELEGHSRAEIAESLGVSLTAVQTLLVRARSAIRELLEEDIDCAEAERAVADQLAGTLAVAEQATLRAHLRRCEACAVSARRRRARRIGITGLGWFPLPTSLSSLLGGGSTMAVPAATVPAAGSMLAGSAVFKAAAVLATGAIVAGGGYEVVQGSSAVPAKASHTRAVRETVLAATRPGGRDAHQRAAGAAVVISHQRVAKKLAQRTPNTPSHGAASGCRRAGQSCGLRTVSKGTPGSRARAAGSLPVTTTQRRFPHKTQGSVHAGAGSLGRAVRDDAGLASGGQRQAANNGRGLQTAGDSRGQGNGRR